jgi:hypothetical protein
METRNVLTQALADGLYLRLDTTNDPLTGNLHGLHYSAGDGSQAPTAYHMMIGQDYYTAADAITKVGIGMFPHYNPSAPTVGNAAAIQGNQWWGTTNWNAGSSVRCLDFFPAPDSATTGAAGVTVSGILTGGQLNVASRTITADIAQGIGISMGAYIFGGPGITTYNVLRGLFVSSPASQPSLGGLWTRMTGVEIEPLPTQARITNSQAIWLKGDGQGSDIVFGAGSGVDGDAKIYYDGTNLIIHPRFIGTGRVLIGPTGQWNMLLNDIEIDGDLNHDGAGVGFYGTAPIVQPTVAGTAQAAHVAVGGAAVQVNDTFGGWTIGEIVQALKNLGLIV